MALVLGHSQVKYVCEVFKDDRLVTLCYPGYRVRDFIEEPTPFDVIPFVSVVAVVVGANDLPWSTPDGIVNDVQTLCDEIRSENPRSCDAALSCDNKTVWYSGRSSKLSHPCLVMGGVVFISIASSTRPFMWTSFHLRILVAVSNRIL